MKVLLVDPGQLFWDSLPSPVSLPVRPSLLAIYSYLRAYGVEDVSILDLEIEEEPLPWLGPASAFEDRCAELLERFEYDVAAISCFSTYSYQSACAVARASRRVRPMATIVVGGWHGLSEPQDFAAESGPFDYVVRGAGEAPLLAMARGELRRDGGATRVLDGRLLSRAEHARFRYLFAEYVKQLSARCPRAFRTANAVILPISRGCPYSCRFCGNSLQAERSWVPLEVPQALALVEEALRALPGVDSCYFGDAIFGAGGAWRREMLAALRDRFPRQPYVIITRAELLTRQDVELLSGSGAYVVLGAESLSPHTLTIMNKTPSPERYVERTREVVSWLREARVPHELFLILDHPGETAESLAVTRRELEGLVGPFTSVFGFRYLHFPQFVRDYPEYQRRFGTEMRGPLRWWRENGVHDDAMLTGRYVASKRPGETFESAQERIEEEVRTLLGLCHEHARRVPHSDVVRSWQ